MHCYPILNERKPNRSCRQTISIFKDKSISLTGKLKSEKTIKESGEKMKSKKCRIIKGSSEQFAEVIENQITAAASYVFLWMRFPVKGEQRSLWNYWTVLQLNGNEMKHSVIKEGIRHYLLEKSPLCSSKNCSGRCLVSHKLKMRDTHWVTVHSFPPLMERCL